MTLRAAVIGASGGIGAEFVRQMVCGPTPSAPGQYRNIAIIAETAADARDVSPSAMARARTVSHLILVLISVLLFILPRLRSRRDQERDQLRVRRERRHW